MARQEAKVGVELEPAAAAPRWLWGLGLLGVGACLGVALSRGSASPGAPKVEATKQRALQAGADAARSSAEPSSAQLSRKMLELLAEPAASAPSPTTASDDPQVHEPSVTELLDAVRTQPRDDAWASGAERTLQADLDQLAAALKFRVRGVECRQSRCVAELEWPNGAQAQGDFKAVMATDAHRLDCHRRLLLPGPENASGRAQLLVNCDNQLQGTKTP